jgi:flagellar hook-basal body complex protein FliE
MEPISALATAPLASLTPAQSAQFLPPLSEAGQGAAGSPAAAGSFGQMVSSGLQNVNEQLFTSQTDLQRLALGDAQNLHQIMIRLEESRLSFQLMMQVRNRLLEAYQDVMKMPI